MADDEKTKSLMSQLFGTDLRDFLERLMMKQFQRSWAQQSAEIRRKRMTFVRAMVREEDEISKISIHATAFCTMAIEAVINGDIEDLKSGLDLFLFEDERPTNPEYATVMRARFAKFRQLCLDALDHLNAVEAARIAGEGQARSS